MLGIDRFRPRQDRAIEALDRIEQAVAGAETTVQALNAAARTDEIARMLAGAVITDEARAAAHSLLREA